MLTPAAPTGLEIIQRKLFVDDWVCFFDPQSQAPEGIERFISRPYAKVVFTKSEYSELDRLLDAEGHKRHVALRVSGPYARN